MSAAEGRPITAADDAVDAVALSELHSATDVSGPGPPTLGDPDECKAQAALLRHITGNPFRPVAIKPAWRTETAVRLASLMYSSRDFSAMPILADALQDAGCDNDDVLTHCREGTEHVRGCWVVDLLRGKI